MISVRFRPLFVCLLICGSLFPAVGEGRGDTAVEIASGWSGFWPERGQSPDPTRFATFDWRPVNAVWNPPGRNGRNELLLRLDLPEHSIADPFLFLEGVDQIVEVYALRGSPILIHTFGQATEDGRVLFGGTPFHLIRLNPSDRTLVIRIRSDHTNIGIIGRPILGRADRLLAAVVREDLDRVVLGAWILFAGLFSFFLFSRNRDQSLFLGFFFVCLAGGVYTITRTQIKQLVVDAPLSWSRVELGAFFALPATLYFYFTAMFGPGRWNHRRFLLIAQILFIVVAFGLAGVGVVPLMSTLLPAQVLFLLGLVVLIGATASFSIEGNADARIILLGVGAGAIFGVNDILTAAGLTGWSRFVSHYGVFLFISSLGFLLIRRVTITGEILEKTKQYLSRVIRDMDATIAFRTEALERSRDEIERVSEIARQINSSTELDEILERIFYYFIVQFNLHGCFLYLRDEKTDELVHFKSVLPALAPGAIDRVRGRRVALGGDSFLAKVCRHKKALYLPRIPARGASPEDYTGVELLGLKALFLVPMLVQDRVAGLIAFSNFVNPMDLGRQERRSIARFCEHIAGAVYTASLLREVQAEREKTDRLLLNVLPESVAAELKETGRVEPKTFESATVLFADFKGFTSVVENLDPRELILELDQIFEQFDLVVERNGLEKLKTIGDAYMCAGGLPRTNRTHAVDACLAALELLAFMEQTREIKKNLSGKEFWELRIGINTGALVAGVVGKNKFVYDVWGDTVNVAARMETSGEPGRINLSRATYEIVGDFFACAYRGQFAAKNRGMLDMYFLDGILPELSLDGLGRVPNDQFRALYANLAGTSVQTGANQVERNIP